MKNLQFVLSEFIPVFLFALALVLTVKVLLIFWKSELKVTISQLFFYSVVGVLVGYIENLSGAKIGGLLPSTIVVLAFAINSFLRVQGNWNGEPINSKEILLSVSVAGISFLISARYFALLFN